MGFQTKYFVILQQIEKYALICLIIVMTIVVFLGTITRYMFGFSFQWIEEVPRYCLVWITFLGAASLMKKGVDHPRVTKLVSAIPNPARKYILIGENIIMILITGVMGFGAMLIIRIHSNQLSPAMELPMYVIYAIIPLSAFVSMIRLGRNTYNISKGETISESRFDA